VGATPIWARFETFRADFLEHPRGEFRRIPLQRTWANRGGLETVCDLLHGRGSGAPSTGTQGARQVMFDKERGP
jgi:hypothetical protein